MTASSDKSHLKYESIAAWRKGENVPPSFLKIADDELRDKYISEYGELRRHLFAKHLATLTKAEQTQFETGEHPSQRHEFADRAKPVTEEFEKELQRLGYAAKVEIGYYHMDRIVLSVSLSQAVNAAEIENLPWLYRGFEVKYSVDEPILK